MDPPWRIKSLSYQVKLYDHVLTDDQHAELLHVARDLTNYVAILHYNDPLYNDILNDWHRLDFKASYRGTVREVSLYCNYDYKNVKLMQPALSGKNRTKRQNSKRKAARWLNKLTQLPRYERQLIMEGLKKFAD